MRKPEESPKNHMSGLPTSQALGTILGGNTHLWHVESGGMTVREKFWNWFVKHEPELFNFDPVREAERERLFDELACELRKVDPDLAFEFGPQHTRREFVVSAAGIKRAFPAVVSLVAAAPTLERWWLIAFRPMTWNLDSVLSKCFRRTRRRRENGTH
jgi:hypothetical protein